MIRFVVIFWRKGKWWLHMDSSIMLNQGIFESVSLGKSLLSILFLQMFGLVDISYPASLSPLSLSLSPPPTSPFLGYPAFILPSFIQSKGNITLGIAFSTFQCGVGDGWGGG